MARLFGTDGIRGTANQHPISPDLALKLGQAIGVYFKKRYPTPKVLIGKDTRRSGYMLEQALASGICSVGVDVGFLGPLPTPGIAYLTSGMRACAGIVISASHNPYYDNGIKIFDHDGEKLPDEVEDKLEALMESSELQENMPTGAGIGRARRVDDAIGQYAVFLKEQFPRNLRLDGMRIVIDCANGASYKVAPKVFEELGAEVFCLGVQPNGLNINLNCGALHPEDMQNKVRLYKADIGFAFDGDADRIMACDANGDLLDGDEFLAVVGVHMLKNKELAKNTVVSTVMSNMGLETALKEHGGKLVRVKVGDRYVFKEMDKNGYNLGGEQSGHIIFSDISTTGDGILAALQLLRVVSSEKTALSELRKIIKKLPQVTKSFEVERKIPLEKLPHLKVCLDNVEKQLGTSGRVLFRYSGTEQKARIMVEGQEIGLISQIVDELTRETIKSINNFEEKK